MKQSIQAALALIILLFVSACEKPPESTPSTMSTESTASTAPSSDTFKVALLTPGPVSDAGWNALAYGGLMTIKEELGAEVSHSETKSPQEFEPAFRNFGAEGFDLVIGHGFEYQDAAKAVCDAFPNTVFITTSGNTVRPNVSPIVFCMEEATYLLGIVSARMSRSGKLGLLGGMDIPSIESSFDTFEQGAKSVRPEVEVVRTFIGSWEDVVKGNEATKALINQGVDFIFHNADAAGRGMFQAVKESPGVYCFGSNADQNNLAPDNALASAVIKPDAFIMIATEVKEGRFKPEIKILDMKNGAMEIVWNDNLKGNVPAEVMSEYEATKDRIFKGELNIPIKFLQSGS